MVLTDIAINTGDVMTVGALVVTGLAVVFGVRKAISLLR